MTKRESDGVIFGRHLRELRLARGLTQQQLAALIDSNHPFISNMERGITLPGLAMLVRLAGALECNVSKIVKVLDKPGRTSATGSEETNRRVSRRQ
jgi:transcriptional regulator with XRE-family HTH domain